MSTPNLLDGTEQFMRAAGQPIPDVPTIPPASVIALRMKMLVEEVSELVEAVGFRDMQDYLDCVYSDDSIDDIIQEAIDGTGRYNFDFTEMIDAFHDIAVIAYGGALETAGSDATKAAAAEVTRSNLDKVNGKHGPTVWAGEPMNSKVKKPAGWVGPDIAGVLKASGWEAT